MNNMNKVVSSLLFFHCEKSKIDPNNLIIRLICGINPKLIINNLKITIIFFRNQKMQKRSS